MGTGQMMLVIGAMVLLGIMALSMNRALQDSDIAVSQSGGGLQALGVAQAIIEDAGRLAFDEKLVNGAPSTLPGGLTPADSLSMGPDAGETDPSLFDDIDDYNRYSQSFNVGGEAFLVRVSVGYIDPTVASEVAAPVPGSSIPWSTRYASAPTFYKKMEVRVTGRTLPTEICLNRMFGYHP